MLARLDHELAPARSETDHSGTHLRVSGREGRDLVDRVVGLLAAMGYSAELVAPKEPVPDGWFGLDQVIELSMEEAGALAADWRQTLESTVTLTAETAEALESLLETTMRELFLQFSGSGLPPHDLIYEQVSAAAESVLSKEDAERFRAMLRRSQTA